VKDGPVEEFLAELARLLRRDEEQGRRIVAEVGEHLRDLVAEGQARGLGEIEGETEAVERFGTPRALARAVRLPRRRRRVVQPVSSVVAAGACVALALVVIGTRSPHIAVSAGGHVAARSTVDQGLQLAARRAMQRALGLPPWCRTTIAALNRRTDVQILVAIDPRTGNVLSWGPEKHGYAAATVCHLRPVGSGSGTFRIAAPDPSAPFG
jgi:hypothetical protein